MADEVAKKIVKLSPAQEKSLNRYFLCREWRGKRSTLDALMREGYLAPGPNRDMVVTTKGKEYCLSRGTDMPL